MNDKTSMQHNDLHDYLNHLPLLLSALKSSSLTPSVLKLVVCNETCDLDSTASAIAYAYHLQKVNKHSSTIIMPILNTSRNDFILRPDVVTLLQHYNIHQEQLLFIEDIFFIRETKILADLLQVVLVDHNYPSENCYWLIPHVTEVIDHHEKLIHDIPIEGCSEWLIEKVGSCSTLIVEKMLIMDEEGEECDGSLNNSTMNSSFHSTHLPSSGSLHIDSTSSALLLAAILVDTVCGSPAAGRQTPKDAEAVAKLDETADLPYNHGRFFEWLMSAKFDISKMSTADVLRKDAKLLTVGNVRVILCSVPAPYNAMVGREDLAESLDSILSKTSSSVAIILCLSYTNPAIPDEAKRELAFYSDDSELLFSMASWLQSNKKIDLLLSPYSGTSENDKMEMLSSCSKNDSGTTSPVCVSLTLSERMMAFSQGNVRASRKQILPLVEEFLQSRTEHLNAKNAQLNN